MKPHRLGNGYSGRQFDHVFGGEVGRICKAWGVSGKANREKRASVIFELWDNGQIKVLLAFKDGTHTWQTLLQAKKDQRLGHASLAADLLLAKRLWDYKDAQGVQQKGALSQTLPGMGKAEPTRERYASAFRTLRAYAPTLVPDDCTVAVFGRIEWQQVWTLMKDLAPASRNRVRSAVSRFLTVFLKHDKFHPFRREVMKLMGTFDSEPEEAKEVTVDEFWQLMEHVHEALRPSFVALAATGARVGEYLQCGEPALRRFPTIRVPDGKEGSRDVEVAPQLEPLIRQAIPCRVAKAPKVWKGVQHDARYKRLYKALRAASITTGIECTPHSLRHFYAAEGVTAFDSVFVQHALGHKTPAMTARYAKRKNNRKVAAAVAGALGTGRKVAHA